MFYGVAFQKAYDGSPEFREVLEKIVTDIDEYKGKGGYHYTYDWGMLICEWPEILAELIKKVSMVGFLDGFEAIKDCIASIVESASEEMVDTLGLNKYGAKFITRVDFNKKRVLISFNNGMKLELSAYNNTLLYLAGTPFYIDTYESDKAVGEWLLGAIIYMFDNFKHGYELGFNASDMFSDTLDLNCEYVIDKGAK